MLFFIVEVECHWEVIKMITAIILIFLFISVIKSYIDRVEARIYCLYRILRAEKNSILNDEFFKRELLFLNREKQDSSLKHRIQRKKRLSFLWRHTKNSEKEMFLAHLKAMKK